MTFEQAVEIAHNSEAAATDLYEALRATKWHSVAIAVSEHPDSTPEAIGVALSVLTRELKERGGPEEAATAGLKNEQQELEEKWNRISERQNAILAQLHYEGERLLRQTAHIRAALRRGTQRVLAKVRAQSLHVGSGEVKLRTSKRHAKFTVSEDAWQALATMDSMGGYVTTIRKIDRQGAKGDLVPAFDADGVACSVVRGGPIDIELEEPIGPSGKLAKFYGNCATLENQHLPRLLVLDSEVIVVIRPSVEDGAMLIGRGPYPTKHKAGTPIYEAIPSPEGIDWEKREEHTSAVLKFADGGVLDLATDEEFPTEEGEPNDD